MKKSFLVLAVMMLLGTAAQAQIALIPKAGISISNVNFDQDLAGQKSKTGLVAGLGVNFPITSDHFFSLQPELLYVQQGFQATAPGKVNYNYLQLPLLLKINFGMENLPIYVNAGPSFAYALNGKIGDTEADFDNLNRLDIGLQFGGGVGVKAGPGSLLLDARYGFGLTDINNLDNVPDSQNKSKINAFQLTLGYSIPLGGQ